MAIKSKIIVSLAALFSKEMATIFIAALPILELRAAIPVGIIKFNLHFTRVFLLSVFGNLLPVMPLLLFLKYFFHKLQYIKFIGGFFKWWFASVQRRSGIIEKWGFWGLVCFVSIPLPVTGAWTGTAAATLFEINTKKAFLAISLGVIMAGIIMTILSLVAKELIQQWFTFI